jgi:hypothetical protein
MQERKWFMSKKFWTPIITAVIVALNSGMGWNIPEDQMLAVFVPVIIYLIGEFYLDRKREKAVLNPLADPSVRDAIEALASDFYDYSAARSDGIENHAVDVKEKVMAGLHNLLDPEFTKETKAIGAEVIRMIMKFYKEDQKMAEGADLVRSSMTKKAE